MFVQRLFLVVASATWALFFSVSLQGQDFSKESIYSLDVVESSRSGVSPQSIARYWVGLSKFELKQLRSGKRDDFGLVKEKIQLLEELLDPIFKLERSLFSTPDTKTNDEILRKLRALNEDSGLAETMFSVLGEEQALRSVVERSRQSLRTRQKQAGTDGVLELSSFFSIPQFLNKVVTSAETKCKVKTELEMATKDYRESVGMCLDGLRSISEDRWLKLLDVLSEKQQEAAKEAIGQPIEWFRLPEQPKFRSLVQSDGSFNGGSVLGKIVREKAGDVSQLTKEQLKELKIELFCSLNYSILFERIMWDELNMTESQCEELNGAFRRKLGESILAIPAGGNRFEQLLNGEAEYPRLLSEFLVPDQLVWFRQVETQIRAGKEYDASVGLLNPIAVRTFDISEDQKARLKKIADEFGAQNSKVFRDILLARKEALTELSNRIGLLLSDEEHEKYTRMTGDSLD